MKDAIVAYELSHNIHSPYWIARSAELLGDIFSGAYNYEQTELYTIEAADNYLKAGRIASHRYALCDLASLYLDKDRDEEARSLLDSLLNVVRNEEPLDSALNEYIMRARFSALLKSQQFGELENSIGSYTATINEDTINLSIIKSYILTEKEDVDGAEHLLSESLELAGDEKQQLRIMYASYLQELTNENYIRAAMLADTLLAKQSDIAKDILSESIIGVQKDFYASKAKLQEEKAKFILYILIGVIIIAIIIATLLVSIYRLKMRAKKAELEANISSLVYFKMQAESVSSENERLNSKLNEKSAALELLFRDKWSTLNMLCNEYFEMGDSENTRATILNRIEKELTTLRTKKNVESIEIAVDNFMGNIMSLLREECGFLKEEDFVFLSLVYAGLSVRAVCLFMGMKYKHFYLKKSRLSKRISSSTAPHKDLFIGKMKQSPKNQRYTI